MWGHANLALRRIPAAIGWLVMVIATVFTDKTAKFLTAHQDLSSDWRVWLTVATGVALWALSVYWTARKARFRVDDVREWSVAVDPGQPAVAARNGDTLERYILQMCHFANISTIQAREIELALMVPYYDHGREPLRLWATRDEDLPYEDVWKDCRKRFAAKLTFPIRIPPNSTVEGRIEFEVPSGISVREIDWSSPLVQVVEKRAARTLTIKPNHVFDAVRGQQYRGRIGIPFPRREVRSLLKRAAETAHISRE